MDKIKYTYHNNGLIIGDAIMEISLNITKTKVWLNFKSLFVSAKEQLSVLDIPSLLEKLESLNFPKEITSMGIIMLDGFEETIHVDGKLIIFDAGGDTNYIEPFKAIVNKHLGYDLFEKLDDVSLIGVNNQFFR
jgi:hypothetical protein